MANISSDMADLPLLEQAAVWFDRSSNGLLSCDERARFEQWRSISSAHRLAYAEIEATHARAKAAASSNEMLALRHETLSRIVMPQARRRQRLAIAGAIAASFVAIAGTWTLSDPGFLSRSMHPADRSHQALPGAPTIYRTAVGERLTVALPDGSSATLNTASRLRLAYTSSERRLILERGQALFHVAKGQARPFVVEALDRIVTAHGTVFDVRIAPGKTVKVSLLEGSVSVAKASAPDRTETMLQPDDVLLASSGEVRVARDPDIEKEVSWRDGLIIFEDESLDDATAEVNRYVRTPIVLGDDRLRRIRISGAFRTGEAEAFVEALQLSFPVRVVMRDRDRIVLAYRG
jgi:transmembrane sensor